MTADDERPGDGSGGERTARDASTSRRRFLKATGAGLLASGVGVGAVGSVAGRGIATPWLARDGNLLRDPQGEKVVLRGVNVVDPARADKQFWRHPVEDTVEHATDPARGWYSRVIRVPCAPGEIMGGSEDGEPGVLEEDGLTDFLENLLDPVVEKCAEVGAYCIVDYHRHQTDDYTQQAIHDELTLFWETVASRYAGDSHVLFEVYNEPIGPYAGECQSCSVDLLEDDAAEETWLTWRETAQPWVDTVREHAPQNVVIIGSPRWTQWTYWAQHHEFSGDNLAYAAHAYTHEGLRPLGDYFGDPSESVPVFLSEFGYQNKRHDGGKVPSFLKGTTSGAGEEFQSFLTEYDSVHWQAWCFDHSWAPPMFSFDDATHEWTLQGGEDWQGKFFRDFLRETRLDDVPGAAATATTAVTDDGTASTAATTENRSIVGTPKRVGPNTALPSDPDDDGLYEDVNGNERQDIADAVDLFQHRQEVDARYFDFNDGGGVSIGDAVSLFRENTG